MTGQTRYSNLAETTVVAATSYTYDAANQMTGITDKNSERHDAGVVRLHLRRRRPGEPGDADLGLRGRYRHADYTYTNNDQLTGVTHTDHSFANESFTYDANGNETGTGYTTSTGNEQTASPGYTYTYDADGNMITSTQTSTGDVWTYSYNLRGQMTGAVETNSEDTVLEQVTYTYDALGNRIGMDENGTQTWTLYDGSRSDHGLQQLRLFGNAVSERPDRAVGRRGARPASRQRRHDRLVSAGSAGDGSRSDQQLGGIIDHVDYSAFGTVLDESRPVERRPDDGLRGDGARHRDGAEPGGDAGSESGDGEVDESGSDRRVQSGAWDDAGLRRRDEPGTG